MGGYCRKDSRVRPVIWGRRLRHKASVKVERAGLNSAAWAKATKSAAEAVVMAALARVIGGIRKEGGRDG